MAIERPIKRGDVFTFDESYNKGFKTIWASEVDAEFEVLYDAWNFGVINIAPGSVTSEGLADNSVTHEKMADDAIGQFELIDNAVVSSKIYPGAIQDYHLSANCVSGANIIDGSVDMTDLSTNVKLQLAPPWGPANANQVLTVSGDGSALIWAISGAGAASGDISGTYPGPITVFQSSGDFAVGGKLTAISSVDPITWGRRPAKGRLRDSPAPDDYVGFTINSRDLSAQDNPLQPSWGVYVRCDVADQFLVNRVGPGGGAPTSLLTVNADGRVRVTVDPTNALDLVTKQYVDARPVGISDAPSDGTTYGRKNAAWTAVTSGSGGPAGPDRTVRTLAGGTTVLDGTAEVHFASAISNATLPLASSCPGRVYKFSPANQINLSRSGADTIVIGNAAGVTSLAITASMRVTLISDGISAWRGLASDPALSITGINAGGSLAGTYPSPSLAANSVAPSQLTSAAVQPNKMAGMTAAAGDIGKLVVLDHTNPTTQWKLVPATISATGGPAFSDTLNVAIAAAGTVPIATYKTGSSAVRFRIGALTAGNFQFYSNADFTNAIDDPTKPALAWVYDAPAREFGFYGSPAGAVAAWSQMLALNAAGATVWGAGGAGNNIATLVVARPSAAIKSRLVEHNNDNLYLTNNYDLAASTQDNAALSSWVLNAGPGTGSDSFRVRRVPPGGALTDLLTVDSAGALFLAGTAVQLGASDATKRASVISWANGGKPVAELSANTSQPVATAPTWMLRMDTGGDNAAFQRQAAGGGAWSNILVMDAASALIFNQARVMSHRYSGGGGSISGDGYSNAIAFGWNGSAITARVDNVAPGYLLTVTSASDERVKTKVAEDVPGLDAVLAMRPITFEYVPGFYPMPADGKADAARRHYGMIAQELLPLVPLVIQDVGEKEDHYLGVEYQLLVPVLVQAIKELTARVAALEAA